MSRKGVFAHEGSFRSGLVSKEGAFAHEGSCRRGLVSREGAFAHEGSCRRGLVSRKGAFAHEWSCRRGLVSRKGAFAHEWSCRRGLVSRKGAFAHEGSCRRGLVSREGAFAHEGGCRRGLVSKEGAFAHEGSCRRGLVSRKGAFAHEGRRQRALSQEIIREITSGEKVSSMFLYSETSLVTQCWKRWFSHLLRSCPSGNVCTPKCRRRTPIDPLWQRNRTKTLPDSTPPITNITPHRQVQRSVRLNRLFFKDIEKAAGHYGREAFTNIFINNWLHNTPQSVAGGRHYDETSILNIQ